MRACVACFYYQGGKTDGVCMNRPPYAHVTSNGGDMFVTAVRPPVQANDYCSFYSHPNAKKNSDA